MFDDIYDNGEYLLGKVSLIRNYIRRNADDISDAKELLQDLENLSPDTIVAVYYNHPMGYSFEYWTYEDKIKEL